MERIVAATEEAKVIWADALIHLDVVRAEDIVDMYIKRWYPELEVRQDGTICTKSKRT